MCQQNRQAVHLGILGSYQASRLAHGIVVARQFLAAVFRTIDDIASVGSLVVSYEWVSSL